MDKVYVVYWSQTGNTQGNGRCHWERALQMQEKKQRLSM